MRRLEQVWQGIACWLPSWMVGWYWRRELERHMQRHREALNDPEVRAKLREIPATFTFSRSTGKIQRLQGDEGQE